MKSKKNIVLLTPGFPKDPHDTTCIPSLQALVMELSERYPDELNLHVVSFQYPPKKGSYTWNGISCWSAGGGNVRFPAKWNTWVSVMRHLREYHQQNPIDIIHSFWLNECTLVGKWIAKLASARQIAHIMGQDVLPSNRYMKYIKLSGVKVIANSEFSGAKLTENFKHNADYIIPFGIRESDFNNINYNQERHTHILGVGSLTSVKNFDLFIDLFYKIKKQHPKITGRIIGEGPLKETLQKKINSLKLQKDLFLEGQLPRPQVLEVMAISKILLHTAPFESAGYVFLEALRSGMKVVALNTGYLPNVPGSYPCEDPDEMYRSLDSLLSYDQEFKPVHVHSMKDTASSVYKVYMQD